MEVRYSPDWVRFSRMTTQEVRESFLVENLFKQNLIEMIYSDADRAIIGSAVPVNQALSLKSASELRAGYFCERREAGILNIGGAGTVTVDGKVFNMVNRDCLYIGRGSKEISFDSVKSTERAEFYILSYPAHKEYVTTLVKTKEANQVHLGSTEQANKRTIYQCIHPKGVQSCQLVMGFTELEGASVWNTMPPHTHTRRMEVYMYFDVLENARIFHLIGRPDETRHIVMKNKQAVISPSWSIHSGVGTSAYSFCWGMGGENQAFDDMDNLTMDKIR